MKTAIITGASRGVGRAVAETLAQDGWRLLLNCRSRFDLLEQEAEKLRSVTEVHTVHGPITDEVLAALLGTPGTKTIPILTEEDIERAQLETCTSCEEKSDSLPSHDQQDAYARRTRIETPEDALLLVNNAGISTFNLAQDVSDDELEEMLDANVKDMFRLTRAVIPYMLRASEGRILNMSSVWGVVGASMESVYSLTKGAVNAGEGARTDPYPGQCHRHRLRGHGYERLDERRGPGTARGRDPVRAHVYTGRGRRLRTSPRCRTGLPHRTDHPLRRRLDLRFEILFR